MANSSLFKRIPKYTPMDDQKYGSLLCENLKHVTGDPNVIIERLTSGQGLNFRVRCDHGDQLLKIVVNRGYPNLDKLRFLDQTLPHEGIVFPRLIDARVIDEVAPFGWIIQEWLPGQELIPNGPLINWLPPLVKTLQRVHDISMDFFGDLDHGQRFMDARSRIANMQESISSGFNEVLIQPHTMSELEHAGILPEGQLAEINERCISLFDQLSNCPEPVLLHGDSLPPNLINGPSGWALIDWDEASAGWWPYEAARLSYYVQEPGLLEYFWTLYQYCGLDLLDFFRIVALEHVRQHLRQIFQLGFSENEVTYLRPYVMEHMQRIDILLKNPTGSLS